MDTHLRNCSRATVVPATEFGATIKSVTVGLHPGMSPIGQTSFAAAS